MFWWVGLLLTVGLLCMDRELLPQILLLLLLLLLQLQLLLLLTSTSITSTTITMATTIYTTSKHDTQPLWPSNKDRLDKQMDKCVTFLSWCSSKIITLTNVIMSIKASTYFTKRNKTDWKKDWLWKKKNPCMKSLYEKQTVKQTNKLEAQDRMWEQDVLVKQAVWPVLSLPFFLSLSLAPTSLSLPAEVLPRYSSVLPPSHYVHTGPAGTSKLQCKYQ